MLYCFLIKCRKILQYGLFSKLLLKKEVLSRQNKHLHKYGLHGKFVVFSLQFKWATFFLLAVGMNEVIISSSLLRPT